MCLTEEARQELQREKQVRVALQAQLVSAQQDAKRQAIQELLASNDLDDSTAAKLEARLEVEELRYHCEILQEELFHARSNLEALSWSAHDLLAEHAREVEAKKARKEKKAAEKAERVAAKSATQLGERATGKVNLGLARTTSLPARASGSPKAPREVMPKSARDLPKDGGALAMRVPQSSSPKAPREASSPKAPRATSPKAPRETSSPKAPREATSPKAPRATSPKAPRDAAWSPKGQRSSALSPKEI